MKKRLALIIIPILLWGVPAPDGLTAEAYHFALLFVTMIGLVVSQALVITTSVVCALTFSLAVQFFTVEEALAGYANPIVWLVVLAFFIAQAIIKTGLGHRVALALIARLGQGTLGLGYAICLAEAAFATVIPSSVARGGGIMAPIVKAVAHAMGAKPQHDKHRLGAYLMLVGAQANTISSALFLTAMVANPLVAGVAYDIFQVEFDWVTWFIGASVPGAASLFVMPRLVRRLVRPEESCWNTLQGYLQSQREELGVMRWQEKVVALVLVGLVVGWASKSWHGLHPVVVALSGLVVLILSRAVGWQILRDDRRAWDTLLWLGGMITLANKLKTTGFIDWVAQHMQHWVMGMDPLVALCMLWVVYLYSMFFFASDTAHAGALLGAFYFTLKLSHVPALLAIPALAYASSICSGLTNYSTGTTVIYYGHGYVKPPLWFKVGLVVSCSHIVIWLGGGLLWWRVLGWY